MGQPRGLGTARGGAWGAWERSTGWRRGEASGLGAPTGHPDVRGGSGVLNEINWGHSESSVEEARRTEAGAKYLQGEFTVYTAGKYLRRLHQVSIALGEGSSHGCCHPGEDTPPGCGGFTHILLSCMEHHLAPIRS